MVRTTLTRVGVGLLVLPDEVVDTAVEDEAGEDQLFGTDDHDALTGEKVFCDY